MLHPVHPRHQTRRRPRPTTDVDPGGEPRPQARTLDAIYSRIDEDLIEL